MKYIKSFFKFEDYSSGMLKHNDVEGLKNAFSPYINKSVINLIEGMFIDFEDEGWKCQLWIKVPWRSDNFDVIYTNLEGWKGGMIFRTDDLLRKFKAFHKRNKIKNTIMYYLVLTKDDEDNLSKNELIMLKIEKVRALKAILTRVDSLYEIYDIEYGDYFVDFKVGNKR